MFPGPLSRNVGISCYMLTKADHICRWNVYIEKTVPVVMTLLLGCSKSYSHFWQGCQQRLFIFPTRDDKSCSHFQQGCQQRLFIFPSRDVAKAVHISSKYAKAKAVHISSMDGESCSHSPPSIRDVASKSCLCILSIEICWRQGISFFFLRVGSDYGENILRQKVLNRNWIDSVTVLGKKKHTP